GRVPVQGHRHTATRLPALGRRAPRGLPAAPDRPRATVDSARRIRALRAGVRAPRAGWQWRTRRRLSRLPALGRTRGGDQGRPARTRQPAVVRARVRGGGAAGSSARASAPRSALRLLARSGGRVPGDALVARGLAAAGPRTWPLEPRAGLTPAFASL